MIPRYPLDRKLTEADGPLVPPVPTLVPYTRVSTIAKAVQDKFAIGLWQMRLTVKGLSTRPDLYALAASTPLEDRSRLDDIARQALDAAQAKASANLGNALHTFTDRLDRGEDLEVPPPWDRDLAAYRQALADHDVVLLPGLAECRVVNPELADGNAAGVAGTFDRVVMYEGRPTVADLKTGSDPLKYGAAEITAQLAMYAWSWARWDGEVFQPLPDGLDQERALVIHLPAGKGECFIHELDLAPALEGIELGMRVRAYRKGGANHRPATMAGAQRFREEPTPEPAPVKRPARKRAAKKATAPKKAAAPEQEMTEPINQDWLARVLKAETKSELRTIRSEAQAADAWDGIKQEALAQLAKIA